MTRDRRAFIQCDADVRINQIRKLRLAALGDHNGPEARPALRTRTNERRRARFGNRLAGDAAIGTSFKVVEDDRLTRFGGRRAAARA